MIGTSRAAGGARGRGAAALVLVLYTLTHAWSASAQFGPAADLSAAGEVSMNPDVAVDAAGTSTVVWDEQTSEGFVVRARRVTGAGQLGPTASLSAPGAAAAYPRVVVDPSGRATVVWKRSVTVDSALVQARRIAADGSLGPILDLSGPAATIGGPEADLTGSGTVVVVWTASDAGSPRPVRVQARRIAAGGTVGPLLEPFRGGPPPQFFAGSAQVGGDALDNATVVWSRLNDTTAGSILVEARRIAADGGLGPVRPVMTLPKLPNGGSRTSIVVEPGGLATIVALSDFGADGTSSLLARRLAADGTLGALHTLSAGVARCSGVGPGTAVSAGGRATIVWGCFTAGSSPDAGVRGRHIGPDDALGPVIELSARGGNLFASTPAVVRDVRRVTASWVFNDAARGRVQARRVLPDGRLGHIVDVAVAAEAGLGGPRATTDPGGLTTFVWSHQLGDGTTAVARLAQGRVPIFADVPHGHGAWAWIEASAEAGITSGCLDDPLSYCPDDPVTRGQMAVFLGRGLHGATFEPTAATGKAFDDVPLSDGLAKWIEQLSREGITGGCSTAPARFCATDPVTRGQIAVFLLRARHGAAYVPPAGTGQAFTDVPASHPLAGWIEQLAREGISAGCGGTDYCPDATVSRGQMAVLLVRTFKLPM
jgi:hypothetical protein